MHATTPKPFRLVWLCGLLIGSVLRSQEAAAPDPTAPEWVIDRFFRHAEAPDADTCYTRAMAATYRNRPHLGATFAGPDYTVTQQTFHREGTQCAIAVHVLHGPSGKAVDYYAFLRYEDRHWRLDTLRQFFVPPAVGQVFAALTAQRNKLGDEEMHELAMIQAFAISDADLEKEFRSNEETFDQLAAAVVARGAADVIQGKRRDRTVDAELWKKVRDLKLYYVQLQPEGWVECARASLASAAVGFLWVHPRADPPQPTPEKFIYLQKLSPRWYVFRRQ